MEQFLKTAGFWLFNYTKEREAFVERGVLYNKLNAETREILTTNSNVPPEALKSDLKWQYDPEHHCYRLTGNMVSASKSGDDYNVIRYNASTKASGATFTDVILSLSSLAALSGMIGAKTRYGKIFFKGFSAIFGAPYLIGTTIFSGSMQQAHSDKSQMIREAMEFLEKSGHIKGKKGEISVIDREGHLAQQPTIHYTWN